MARRNENGVRLYTRNGYDFAGRFPQIVEAVSRLKVRSCFIDGEAIVVDERGLSTFELDGAIIFQQACALGCEGIVSKRHGSVLPLRPG